MRKHKAGDHVLVKLSGGRIAEATVKAVVNTEEEEGTTVYFQLGVSKLICSSGRGSFILSMSERCQNIG
jgi:hypothetical protein